MVSRKIKIIPRKPGADSKWSIYEDNINKFLSTVESHHVKQVVVHDTFAIVEYIGG